MELGLFQLENLILTRTGFCFLDLRPKSDQPVEKLGKLLDSAQRVAASEAVTFLRNSAHDKGAPIVLVCSTGEVSSALAQNLEALGYGNVYVVKRGVSGLLEDL